jgi:hypothetical protein
MTRRSPRSGSARGTAPCSTRAPTGYPALRGQVPRAEHEDAADGAAGDDRDSPGEPFGAQRAQRAADVDLGGWRQPGQLERGKDPRPRHQQQRGGEHLGVRNAPAAVDSTLTRCADRKTDVTTPTPTLPGALMSGAVRATNHHPGTTKRNGHTTTGASGGNIQVMRSAATASGSNRMPRNAVIRFPAAFVPESRVGGRPDWPAARRPTASRHAGSGALGAALGVRSTDWSGIMARSGVNDGEAGAAIGKGGLPTHGTAHPRPTGSNAHGASSEVSLGARARQVLRSDASQLPPRAACAGRPPDARPSPIRFARRLSMVHRRRAR